MNFSEYLLDKKIDEQAFRKQEPDRFHEWEILFEEISTASFTAQKLYLINPVRRKYPLQSGPTSPKPVAPAAGRPVFKPKIK